jgi:hypothetical protein
LGPDYYGSITDLRGDIIVSAGAVGGLIPLAGALPTLNDPRAADPNVFPFASQTPGPIFTPGDGSISVETRGDLVLGGVTDVGMALAVDVNGTPYTSLNANGSATLNSSGGVANFTLFTPTTAIDLYTAGGDAAALEGNVVNGTDFYPGTLIVAAANGNVRFQPLAVIELLPSPTGQLELLAAGSIFGSNQVLAMSGADMSTLATPFHPVFSGNSDSNASANSAYLKNELSPIAFGEDTPISNLHAGDSQPALVYAGVDIVDLQIGQSQSQEFNPANGFNPTHTTWYTVAKPIEVIAGRDIVGTGANANVFMNNGANDISLVQAGRDIFYESVDIVGPGLLQVQAGRNLYQSYYGSLVSVGDVLNPGKTTGGAGITVLTGVGANGPDYTDFARLYFNAANQLPDDGTPLADSGKVVHAYDQELLAWLQQRFGYTGTSADALAYFLALPSDQQGIFVRQIYYEELTAGGREYNDTSSPRFRSYLRGRDAIATLFPDQDAQGNPVTYTGKFTMFSGVSGSTVVDGVTVPVISDAGIQTQFGGDIQILNPGGQTIIGVEGVSPGAGAGLITQGEGDIDIYSLGSILLGQSRIMTTFGGDILAWSATGDINAGRGSKTTTIFTPPKRAYDAYGNITVSPNVPSTGAGIATLAPIPEVPPGAIDLIAPLGTIDAGEAGIRHSGNVNLAALQIVNALNITGTGTVTGLTVPPPANISGALSANSTAGAAQKTSLPTQSNNTDQPSIIIVEFLGFGGGDGSSAPSQPEQTKKPKDQRAYDTDGAVQVVGHGELTYQEKQLLSEDERRGL